MAYTKEQREAKKMQGLDALPLPAESIMPDPEAPKPDHSARRAELEAALAHLRGHSLQILWDDKGSVTFKRGVHAESIHQSANTPLIVRTAERIAGHVR